MSGADADVSASEAEAQRLAGQVSSGMQPGASGRAASGNQGALPSGSSITSTCHQSFTLSRCNFLRRQSSFCREPSKHLSAYHHLRASPASPMSVTFPTAQGPAGTHVDGSPLPRPRRSPGACSRTSARWTSRRSTQQCAGQEDACPPTRTGSPFLSSSTTIAWSSCQGLLGAENQRRCDLQVHLLFVPLFLPLFLLLPCTATRRNQVHVVIIICHAVGGL